MAATTALVTGLAVGFSLSQTKLYESSADVYLGSQNLPTSLAEFQPGSFQPDRIIATQANLARLPTVAAKAIAQARVTDMTPGDLLGTSTVTNAPDTDILTFTVHGDDRAAVPRLATSYARAYTAYRRQLDSAAIVQARRRLDERIAQLQHANLDRGEAYATLVRKSEELQTVEVLQAANASVVRTASDTTQIQPKPARNGLLGFIFGLLLGIALTFVRDALNTKVTSAVEIQERLQVPLLGRIAEPPRRMQTESKLVMLESPHGPEAEAYRMLATSVGFANLERGARSLMITSAARAEGKSTTISNLAIALARAGQQVVLVDLDLRRPGIGRFFGLEKAPGVTNVVLGRVDLAAALVEVPLAAASPGARESSANGAPGHGSLTILPAGASAPNPAEVTGSIQVSEILSQLSQRAAIVLVDGPPILHVSDAMAMTAKVDAVLVVALLERARRPVLNELRRVLGSAPVVTLGFILTGAVSDEGYGYGYGYGYETKGEVPAGEFV